MNEVTSSVIQGNTWKVLIVDDAPEIHEVTSLVLTGFEFEGKPLEFLHAYSSADGKIQLTTHQDIAMILLDVVMETEHAGLDLAKWIREELKNQKVRIVLRTGQPGQAPEHDVIANYDINDYKEKTELTAQKLTTSMYASLRAYRDVMIIEANKRGLERVIESSARIFSHEHSHEFASAVLAQLTNLVGMNTGVMYCRVAGKGQAQSDFVISAATGEFTPFVNKFANEHLPSHVSKTLEQAFRDKRHVFLPDYYVLHFTDARQAESLMYIGESKLLSPLDYKLVEVFCTNVSIAFENVRLNSELFESQLEMVCLLAGAAETRSRETANHVRRVGHLAEMLSIKLGLDEKFAELMRFAAPLHDVGKIGIPDSILNKPGPHTPEETRIMRTHAEIGAQLLGQSKRPIIKLGAQIALDHHENWDGTGYPRALKGEEISIAGRITAIADVFDALGSRRCYKEPWPESEIRAFIESQRGLKFDPSLVDLLFNHWHQATSLREYMPD